MKKSTIVILATLILSLTAAILIGDKVKYIPKGKSDSINYCNISIPAPYWFLYNSNTKEYILQTKQYSNTSMDLYFGWYWVTGDTIDFVANKGNAFKYSDTCLAKKVYRDWVIYNELCKKQWKTKDSIKAIKDSLLNDFKPIK